MRKLVFNKSVEPLRFFKLDGRLLSEFQQCGNGECLVCFLHFSSPVTIWFTFDS